MPSIISKYGIYKIQSSIPPFRLYIGSTKDLKRRKRDHFNRLLLNISGHPLIQSHYNEFGKGSLFFEVLEYVENVSQLLDREQFWIDSFDFDLLFNVCPNSSSSKGRTYSDQHKKRLSEIHKKKIISPETREKMRVGRIGLKRNPLSLETKEKMSKARKGIKPATLTCPHCGKIGDPGNSKKNHFDNCKFNPNYVNRKVKQIIICPHCKKEGSGIGAMAQHHFNNCKHKTL